MITIFVKNDDFWNAVCNAETLGKLVGWISTPSSVTGDRQYFMVENYPE